MTSIGRGITRNGSAPRLANLAPRELVETALTAGPRKFLSFFGDTLILLVSVGAADSDLAITLGATAPRVGEGIAAMPAVEPIEFETVPLQSKRGGVRFASLDDREAPDWLARYIASRALFVVRLCKRVGIDAAYSERISVGRTLNMDIVLRDAAVSKFHGWFAIDEQGETYFTDADSKNRTRINGRVVDPQQRNLIQAGDDIRFGSVDALLCSAAAFWAALQVCART